MTAPNKINKRTRISTAVAGVILLGYFAAVTPGCNELPFAGPSGTGFAEQLLESLVSGRAVDAKILGGSLTIYSYKNGGKGLQLAEPVITSEEDGSYELNLRAPRQPILIEVTGGHYFEEASGQRIDLAESDKLRAVAFHQPGVPLNVYVTPFTNMAAGLAEYKVNNGSIVENAIAEANSAITAIVGVDILGTDPKNITDDEYANQSLDDGLRYGFYIAAISSYTADQSVVNSFEPHENNNFTSIAFHDIAYRDILSDGQLDGVGQAVNSNNVVQLGMGITELNQNTYRTQLARHMIRISNDPDTNKTSISATDLIFDAQDLAANGSGLLDGMMIEPLDNTPPVIQSMDHYDSQHVSGEVTFKVAATDFTGISELTFFLDGQQFEVADLKNPSFTFDSSQYSDGAYVITVEASDALNNKATFTQQLNFVNNDTAWTPIIVTTL